MKKPKSVILLLVWFIWSSGRSIDILVRYSVTSDYYAFSSNGLEALYFFLAITTFLLNTSAVYFLFKPHPQGYHYVLAAPVSSAIASIATMYLAIQDIAGVREAYAVGRELRGLAVREKALDKIFTVEAMAFALVIVMVIYIFVFVLTLRNKFYFETAPLQDEA